MTESIVAFTRDWHANHDLAEQILSAMAARSIHTLYHFGQYGAEIDEFGRNCVAERVENRRWPTVVSRSGAPHGATASQPHAVPLRSIQTI